jgi:hypothetical protein
VPDERTFKVAAEVFALASIVAECTTIVQTRSNLTGAHVVVLTSIMMKDLNHTDPNLTVKVIDIDAPGTGRIPCTLIRPYIELEPESKRAFERSYEELTHRANMKTGGITAFDKRDFGLDVRFTHRTEQFLIPIPMCGSRSWMCSSITPFKRPEERCFRLASTESPVLQVQLPSPFRACGCPRL